MRGSIYFHNLKNEELKLYLTLITNDSVSFDKTTLNERHTLAEINILQNLIDKGFLKESETQITLPNPYDLVNHFLQQEYDYRSSDIELEGEPGYLGEIKKYLLTVQKQLTHVETESRKAFLNLRKMVDKISEQGKNNLNYAFERALDRNTESGTWISIPHISPVGLYEPIEEIKNKFKVIIEELENSMQNLLTDYMETMLSKVSSVIEPGLTQLDKPELIAIKNTLQNSILAYKQIVKETKDKFIVETQRFNKEVLNALYNQINTLEQNLGGDLMKQFDAIERLNELKPERIWIMLEETRSELTMHLNSVYSRILREINTLQLQVDISKVSLILTNEAGKAIKRVDKMAEVEYENATLIMELLEILKTKSIEVD